MIPVDQIQGRIKELLATARPAEPTPGATRSLKIVIAALATVAIVAPTCSSCRFKLRGRSRPRAARASSARARARRR